MIQLGDLFDQFDEIRSRRGFQIISPDSCERCLDGNFPEQMKLSLARKRQ
jgi:hypothetical protein